MNKRLIYLALAGSLLLAGVGCGKGIKSPGGPPSGEPSAIEEQAPTGDDAVIDDAVDAILNDVLTEADSDDDDDADIGELKADSAEINSFQDSTYEIE